MRIVYDEKTDSLTIVLREATIHETDEVTPNVHADYDDVGEIVSFEILRASHIVGDPADVVLERSA